MRSGVIALCAGIVAVAASAWCGDYHGVKVTKILTSTTAANGQKLSYLVTDRPEVTALVVEIPPGGETGWHLHGVPVYAYLLAGSISVEMADGKSYDFREGEAIFEVMNTSHNGRNKGTVPARLAVFYTGEEGKPNVARTEKPATP
jgi:quercetin dioxygenase-like cupin family protein